MINVTGCAVAFLTVGGAEINLSPATFKAMDILTNMGVKNVVVLRGVDEATSRLAKIQERNAGVVPPDKKFLKLTKRGEIVELFA